MWTIINLIKNSKLIQMVLAVITLIGLLIFIHYHGYKQGEHDQKAYYEAEYNKKLNEALAKREVKQAEVHEEAKETVKAEVQIKTVFKDKIVEVEKIIEKSPEIKDCNWNDEAFQEYLQKRREIK